MDFEYSDRSKNFQERLKAFIDEFVVPGEEVYFQWLKDNAESWDVPPVMDELKAKAKDAGLWNLFLPDDEYGAGLSNVDYAPLAEMMGQSFIASEVFNCAAPDSGNMEVLAKYGSNAQKNQWLDPLLSGDIRSAFCMTEPDVASSDATNMEATAIVDGDDVILNGRKWWITGIGHPKCDILIFMGVSDASAARHAQHSMVLVPRDTAGVELIRPLSIFGHIDRPHGHFEVAFNDVRVPKNNVILGLGRGFEIAQGRLGPGRIHHCMRCIGAAEKALELMIKRGIKREAFGKPIINLGGNRDIIADGRMVIEQARLLTLKAAHMMDTVGTFGAMSEISMIKVIAPNMAQNIIDQAIQMHGGCGLSDDVPLASMYAINRIMRLADGPDEVHRGLVAKLELRKYR